MSWRPARLLRLGLMRQVWPASHYRTHARLRRGSAAPPFVAYRKRARAVDEAGAHNTTNEVKYINRRYCCPSYYVFYPHFGAYLVRDRYFAATLVRHSAWYSTAPVYGRGYASPTIARARVPANAVPSQRVSADPRATSMARPAGNPGIASRGSASPSYMGAGGAARAGGAGFGSRPAGMTPGASRPSTSIGSGRITSSFRSNSSAGGYPNFAGSGPRSLVERSSPYSSGRQVRSLGSLPSSSYASPGFSSPSGSFSSPRYSSPSGSFSTPRYSSPSTFSSPRYSAPSSSYSSPHFSAPSGSYSAPSHSFSSGHSFSGGGSSFHGGGGGSRGGGGRHR